MEKIHENPIKEARRYITNAKNILKEKAGRDDELKMYLDKKFVRIAGNTIWKGVLIAVDGTFNVKDKMKKHQRPDFKDYKEAIDKRDKKIGRQFLETHEMAHKYMGYDGASSYGISKSSISSANDIINHCEKIYNKNNKKICIKIPKTQHYKNTTFL